MNAAERTGVAALEVSRLGIGCGTLSNDGGSGSVESMLTTAWDLGLRYFDTAPLYLAGESERRLGRFLAGHDGSDVVISTKVGRYPAPPGERRFDFSADATRASIERSLENLGIDRIGLAIIHDVDLEMHDDFEQRFAEVINECYPALVSLRDAGVIDAIGLSSRQSEVCLRAAREVPLDAFMMAGSYTLLNHEPLDELLPFCVGSGIRVLLASPFNTGILATGSPASHYEYGPAPDTIVAKVAAMNEVCAHHGVTLAVAALQFPLLHPAVAAIVTGHREAAEVERNVAALGKELPSEFWADLVSAGLIPASAPTA